MGKKYKKRRTGQKCLTHIHWLKHKRANLLPKQLTSAKEMNDLLGRQTRDLTQLSMLAIALVTFSLIWYLKGHHLGKLTSERKVECVWGCQVKQKQVICFFSSFNQIQRICVLL